MPINLAKAIQEGGYHEGVFVGKFNGDHSVVPYSIQNLHPGENNLVTIMVGNILAYDPEQGNFTFSRKFKTPLAPHLNDPTFNEKRYLNGKRRGKRNIETRLP